MATPFLRFWFNDATREQFLSSIPKEDLPSFRLVCHDFGVRAAPHLFEELSITFRSNTFGKPARMAALERLGPHVKTLNFTMEHTSETFLPPLLDCTTGEEVEFIYEPYCHDNRGSTDRLSIPTYGSWEMTDLLVKQYPPLFHAAANVPSFIKAFSSLTEVTHLKISTPGQEAAHRYRRSVVDYALISLRIAVERSPLRKLDCLSLLSVHPSSIHYLNPSMGYGTLPNSLRRWRQLRTLIIHMDSIPSESESKKSRTGMDHLKLLHSYLQTFSTTLQRLTFHWKGEKGLFPLALSSEQCLTPPSPRLACPRRCHLALKPLKFEKLIFLEVDNITTDASQVSGFILAHRRSISEFNFKGTTLREGSWDDALDPLTRISGNDEWKDKGREVMDVPIMFSPMDIPELQQGVKNGFRDKQRKKAKERAEKSRCPTPLLGSLGGVWGIGRASDYAYGWDSPPLGKTGGFILREQISKILRPSRLAWR
jgi:hypothetical protein